MGWSVVVVSRDAGIVEGEEGKARGEKQKLGGGKRGEGEARKEGTKAYQLGLLLLVRLCNAYGSDRRT